jgi:predicted Zn-dependent protease
MLAERQLRRGAPAAALETARAYSARFPENYILGMLHAKALLANGRYREGAAKLAGLRVIPYEGSIEGRRLYRETHLMLAVEALKRKDATAARREVDAARLWPENLGAGKPYPADVDERLEDFLAAQGLAQRGRTEDASTLLQQVAGFTGRQRERGAGTLVHALSLKQAGRDAEGQKLLAEWTARDPAGALVAWAARAYVGDVGPLPDGAGEEARVLAAWLAPRSPGSVSE